LVLAGQAARSISTGRLHALRRVHRHAYLRCGLQRTFRSLQDSGEFILGKASRLDAFSVIPSGRSYPAMHWHDNRYTSGLSIPSSRTRNSAPQFSNAHGR